MMSATMTQRRRRRGEGNVSLDRHATAKAGREVWIARVSLGVVGGKRIVHKARAGSRKAADRELDRLRRLYLPGRDISTATVDEYLRSWLASHRRVRESTLVSYRGHVALHISPLLGGLKVAKLRPSDVDRLIAHCLGKGLSPTTVGRIVTTLRIALNAGMRRGDLPDNPAARVDLPRVERPPIEPLTTAQAQAILAAVEGHWTEHVVRLLLGSGIRLGEACALNQGDLALEEGFVRLRESKTTVRAVPISDDAIDALLAALRAAPRVGPDEPVFFGLRRNRRGNRDRLQGWSVSHAFPRLLKNKGLARMAPHGLRHGAATLMLAAGHSLPVIGKQLGHRSTAMTARYAHVVPEAQRAAITALDVRPRPTPDEASGQ